MLFSALNHINNIVVIIERCYSEKIVQGFKQMKSIKLFLLIIISIIALVCATALLLSKDDYQKALMWSLQKFTSYQITSIDDLSITYGATPIITLKNLALHNDSDTQSIKADTFAIEFALASLFSDQLKIKKILIHNGEIIVAHQEEDHGSFMSIPSIEYAELKNISISCHCNKEKPLSLFVDNLQIVDVSGGKKELSGSGKFEGVPFKLASHIEENRENKNSSLAMTFNILDTSLSIKGSIEDLSNIEGFDLTVIGDTKELANVMNYFVSDTPKLGKAHISAQLKGDIDNFNISKISATLNNNDATSLAVTGAIHNLKHKNENASASVDLLFKENSLKPIAFVGQVLKDNKQFKFDGDINIDGLPLKSDLLVSLQTTPILLSGKVQTEQLHVDSFSLRQASPGTNPDTEKKGFKNTALRLNILKKLDINLLISAFKLTGTKFEIEASKTRITSKSGLLVLEPTTLTINDNPVKIQSSIQSISSPPIITLDIQAQHFDVAKLFTDPDNPPGIEGDLTFHLESKGQGNTIGDVIDAMDGQLAMVMDEGIINQSGLQLMSTDVVGWLFEKVINKKQTKIICAVNQNEIKNGVLTSQILQIELQDMEVSGSGLINLNEELIDLTLYADDKSFLKPAVPIEVKGDLFSPSVTMLPSVSSLTSLTVSIIPHLFLADVLTTNFLELLNMGDQEKPCQ